MTKSSGGAELKEQMDRQRQHGGAVGALLTQ